MINPFRKLDKESEDFKRAEAQVKSNLEELSRIANDLLLDTRYRRFNEIIKEAEDNTVDLLLRYREDDPYKFKAKVDEFLVELKTYRTILNSVKDLAEPKKPENPHFVQRFKEQMSGFINRLQ